MKKIFTLILFFTITFAIKAQITSIDAFAEYSMPSTKRINVTDIDGVGAGVKMNINVYDKISVNLTGAYTLYSLSQTNALDSWDWKFWARYNDFVKQTLSDEAYKNFMSPIQKMDLLQLALTVDYDFTPIEKLHVKPVVGAGIYFYTRRLYIDETWSKYFSSLNYTFEYEFRNIAPEKYGNPLFYTAGLDMNYQLMQNFWLFGSAKYANVFASDLSYGYNNFPFRDAINLTLGITILY